MISEQPPLVIWGASGHALVVADIVRLQNLYRIIGFLDDINIDRHGAEFCSTTILDGKEQLGLLRERGVVHILLDLWTVCKILREVIRYGTN